MPTPSDEELQKMRAKSNLMPTSLSNMTDEELEKAVYGYLLSTNERVTEQYIIIELYKRLFNVGNAQ